MKLKTLRKKIRRIEVRIQEDSTKLAKLKRRLDATAATKARKAQKRAATRALARQTAVDQDALGEKIERMAAAATRPSRVKVKRRPNISAERRAQLSEAMKARWAAKRAAAAAQVESVPVGLNPTPQPEGISTPANIVPVQIPSAS